MQLVMLPMFLFATTFYPGSVYPAWLRPAVVSLPLYQSIELLRGLCLGHPGTGQLVAAAYLGALGLAGLHLADRRLANMLQR